MQLPNFDKIAGKFGSGNSKRWKTKGTYVGDIENYQLIQDGIYYSLWDSDTLVAYCSLTDSSNEVDNVWVKETNRGKRLFSMILWFFKTRLNCSRLLIGPVHSAAMQEVVKGLSRFEKSWVNIQTNEKVPFDSSTVDNFYSYAGATPWRLVLENSSGFNWPPFKGSGFVTEEFAGYLD